jgi:hypothetical protein
MATPDVPESSMPQLFRSDAARLVLLVALIVVAALTRLVPGRPPNFSPIEAMALFAGAVFASRYVAVLVPLAAMLISDMVIGLHSGMWLVYGCMAVIALAGTRLGGRISALRVVGYGLGAAVFFFIVTNFAVWAGAASHPQPMYTPDLQGLVNCYIAAIPFFRNQVAGVLIYSAVLFGAHALLVRRAAQPAAA